MFIKSLHPGITEKQGCLVNLSRKPFKNIAEKGENADIQHFLLFLEYFLPCERQTQGF